MAAHKVATKCGTCGSELVEREVILDSEDQGSDRHREYITSSDDALPLGDTSSEEEAGPEYSSDLTDPDIGYIYAEPEPLMLPNVAHLGGISLTVRKQRKRLLEEVEDLIGECQRLTAKLQNQNDYDF